MESFYCDPRLNQTERCFSAPGTAESEVQAQATEKRTTCLLTKFTIVPKSERGSVDGVPEMICTTRQFDGVDSMLPEGAAQTALGIQKIRKIGDWEIRFSLSWPNHVGLSTVCMRIENTEF